WMRRVTERLVRAMPDAMACGKAVAATTAGGIPEAIEDGRQGLLVPPHHEAELADAIVTLLRDAELRARLGAAGRQRVIEEFGVEQLVTRTLKVYERRQAG